MNNTQEITLDIRDNQTYEQLYAKQYDYGSSIVFHITKNGKPFDIEGVTAVFQMKKPDNHIIENEAEVIDGSIVVKITEQMTAAYGKAKFSIALFKYDAAITTITGIMKIDEAVIHPEDIESSDEYNVIVDILNSVLDSKEAAVNAKASESAAKSSEASASQSAISASENAVSAANSASAAAISEANASASERNANICAVNASESAGAAGNKADSASNSAKSASAFSSAAAQKATDAENSAIMAESYTHGGTGTRENEKVDNSKYYYEQSKSISESLSGALRPMGTVAFTNLPLITDATEGDMYNISDEFTTTSDFKEGEGYTYPVGTNIYKTTDGYWDCLAGTTVTGVKGNHETTYRKGNINLTPNDIGALSQLTPSDINGLSNETGLTNLAQLLISRDELYFTFSIWSNQYAYPQLWNDIQSQIHESTDTFGYLTANRIKDTIYFYYIVYDRGDIYTWTYTTNNSIGMSGSHKIQSTTGDSSDNIITFEQTDTQVPENLTSWTSMPIMASGESHNSLFNKISTAFKNIRYLNLKKQDSLGYTPVQQGGGIGQSTNKVKIGWNNKDSLLCTVDNSDRGAFVFASNLSGKILKYVKKTASVTLPSGGYSYTDVTSGIKSGTFIACIATPVSSAGTNSGNWHRFTTYIQNGGKLDSARIVVSAEEAMTVTVEVVWLYYGNL